jgi:hypothetical protein
MPKLRVPRMKAGEPARHGADLLTASHRSVGRSKKNDNPRRAPCRPRGLPRRRQSVYPSRSRSPMDASEATETRHRSRDCPPRPLLLRHRSRRARPSTGPIGVQEEDPHHPLGSRRSAHTTASSITQFRRPSRGLPRAATAPTEVVVSGARTAPEPACRFADLALGLSTVRVGVQGTGSTPGAHGRLPPIVVPLGTHGGSSDAVPRRDRRAPPTLLPKRSSGSRVPGEAAGGSR